jgi:hypothetical protein
MPTAAAATLPPAVLRYCEAHQLFEALQTALRLAERSFPEGRELRVAVELDPETEDQHIVIDVVVRLPVADAVARKQEYTRQWVRAVPPEVIGKIRLVLDIG